MPDLKLAKLPDRTPVKIAIAVSPELNEALRQYAEVYRAAYGEAESIAELIPFMLRTFLDGDKGFAKARKEVGEDVDSAVPITNKKRRGRRPAEAGLSSTSGPEE